MTPQSGNKKRILSRRKTVIIAVFLLFLSAPFLLPSLTLEAMWILDPDLKKLDARIGDYLHAIEPKGRIVNREARTSLSHLVVVTYTIEDANDCSRVYWYAFSCHPFITFGHIILEM